jgi:hypothetical protein
MKGRKYISHHIYAKYLSKDFEIISNFANHISTFPEQTLLSGLLFYTVQAKAHEYIFH